MALRATGFVRPARNCERKPASRLEGETNGGRSHAQDAKIPCVRSPERPSSLRRGCCGRNRPWRNREKPPPNALASCDEFLPPRQQVGDKLVGPDQCLIASELKRENARLLAQKDSAIATAMYEIRGVSHFDAGQTSLPDLLPETLDLGGLMESFIDMLAASRRRRPVPTLLRSLLIKN
jgi:hypothetical protein